MQTTSRNHPLLLLSGVGTNAIGYDLSPGVGPYWLCLTGVFSCGLVDWLFYSFFKYLGVSSGMVVHFCISLELATQTI